MAMVLWSSNRPRFAPYTGYGVGVLIVCYVFPVFAPVSGFSMNPARTTASACFADVWTSLWIYFAAPLLGMGLAAALYVGRYGAALVLCAKVHAGPPHSVPVSCVTSRATAISSLRRMGVPPPRPSHRGLRSGDRPMYGCGRMTFAANSSFWFTFRYWHPVAALAEQAHLTM